MTYLFTFHTNFDANAAVRKLKQLGTVKQQPVPRSLSSSCGTAVRFSTDDPAFCTDALLNLAFEKLYMTDGQDYHLLSEKE